VTSRTLWHLLRRHLGDTLLTLRLRGTLRFGSKHRLLSPPLLLALEKRCPQLHLLSLADTDLRPVPSATIPASLTALELSRCEIPPSWFSDSPPKPFPRLHHLVIHNVPAFSDHHLLNISTLSSLKTLSLCGTYRLTATGIRRAAPRLGELERLVLRCRIGSDSAIDSAIDSISRHMKRLRFLELSDVDLTDSNLDSLTNLQLLESLCLRLCPGVSPGAVIALCQALPDLRNLRLIGVRLEDEVVDKIQMILPRCSFSHAA
ncbi:F-box/LRR-repeat protein 12, partial [Antrostomus carolinensis]|uniref:F-box/LRR-repeat protein 12 n=1 Tax=Antrostomus carolinensis TaxID=279965 RepID=UPI0005287CD0